METNNPTVPVINVSHSDCSDLNKSDSAETNVDVHDPPEGSDPTSPVNERENENNQKDDQESVIIEDDENKTIEINADSDEELELNSDLTKEDLSNATSKPFTKATEFVIVNAGNMTVVEVEDEPDATNRYAIEDIHIKDELAESITADLNTNDVLENDPMDLLELNTRSDCASSARSNADTDDYGDDVSSIGSSSVQTGSTSSISTLDWIKDYPWLLYEEGDDPLGYCLYCDSKINTKSQRSVKQHGSSLYHKERCENYLAFREEEEKNGLSMKLVDIKEEFGTDSRVEALKLKRKSQSGALNNFNWRRWLEDYPWLKRDSAEGTIGLCKYCLIHVNIEFSYMRDRHQEAVKHREAEKHFEEFNESREQRKLSSVNEEKDKDSTSDNNQPKNGHKWLELVEKEPLMARCKICGSKVFKNNFLRHLRTNLHEQNEKIYLQSQKNTNQPELEDEPAKNHQNWKLYTKHHPWLVSDPSDSTFAYCKYCEKRIIYGASAAKRATHENSSQHKYNEVEFKQRSRKPNTGKKHEENGSEDNNVKNNNEEDQDDTEDNEEDNEGDDDEEDTEGDDNEEEAESEDNKDEVEDDDEEDEEGEEGEEMNNEDEESQQGKESDDDNESKKRVYKLTDEWISQYSWCKRYGKDPTNFIYCIYCKIPLSVSYSRSKHQSTSFHISAEKEFLDRKNKKQKTQERVQSNETLYEWAIPLKNNPSSYSCRYCRVRISKNYSKKQHEASKIHQINESIYKNNRRKSLRRDENTNANTSEQIQKVGTQLLNVTPTNKLQTFAKVVIKAPATVTLIKQWQKKFPWLTYKRTELRSHYGHCKVCNSSLYIRSLKHVLKHSRSGRHISIIKAKKMQKVEKNEEVDGSEIYAKIIKKGSKEELTESTVTNSSPNEAKLPTPITTAPVAKVTQTFEPQKAHNYKSTIVEMKKRFSWIEKSERPNYAFCRFCNSNIPLKILFLKNHSNSKKHRHCVINYYSTDGKEVTRETHRPNKPDLDDNTSKGGAVDDDVMIVEDNNEEILISEQDENWAVKSETMDEHEELDYLLQRSFNNTLNPSNKQGNIRRNINTDDEPPTKRIKRSQSFRRLHDSNTSLVASLLTTPLTLASCLGPLIQQQIQQQANISHTTPNASTAVAPGEQKIPIIQVAESENTYDLFFKSISETMKKLPVDLAAEGKLRVMQIICDLELQDLKRQQSAQCESASSNTSGSLSYQATSTSAGLHTVCNSSVINDTNAEPNGNSNETIITQLNMNTDLSPPSSTHHPSTKVMKSSNMEKPTASSASSPIIGVMDKNGLQTLQFKSSVSKPIPKNTTTTTITSVPNSGIRCIPFKNLSQPATPDASNAKITRIQVPLNTPAQTPNSNANAVNSSKNLINFRNIQITKRIATTPTSVTGPQKPLQQTSTMANKSPQRTFISNIQPQLQRWGCSVNGATAHHTPTSAAVNRLQQLSSQQTSTPISKK